MERFVWKFNGRERCLRRIVWTMNCQQLDVDTAINRALHFTDMVGSTLCHHPERISSAAREKLRSDAEQIYAKSKEPRPWQPRSMLHIGEKVPAGGDPVPAGK